MAIFQPISWAEAPSSSRRRLKETKPKRIIKFSPFLVRCKSPHLCLISGVKWRLDTRLHVSGDGVCRYHCPACERVCLTPCQRRPAAQSCRRRVYLICECSPRSRDLVFVLRVLGVKPQVFLQSIGKFFQILGPLLAKRPTSEETCGSLCLCRTQPL